MKGDLDDLRHRIDLLDESLVKLLNARAACALEIGRLKREMGIPIYQPAREAEVLANVERVNMGPLDQPAMRRLFERVIDEARHLERIADAAAPAAEGPSAQRGGETDGAPPGGVQEVQSNKEES